MTQTFTITDGTTSIDLVGSTSNYVLANYETGLNQWKSGGVFSGSELSEGSVPVFRQYDMFEEKITLHIKGTTQDNAFDNLRSLLELLESGVEYFISGLGNQLYMALKGNNETNTRYAVITAYKIEELPRLFDSYFEVGGNQANTNIDTIINDLEIVLTRGLWLESPPGTLTRAYLDSQTSFNSVSFGLPASNTEEVFVQDYGHPGNITHVYRFDSSAGTFSSNLVSSSAYDLFPSPIGTDDILYVGSDSVVTDYGRFYSLVFNIGTAAASDFTTVIEYWNGSAWASPTTTTNATSFFRTTGQKAISWSPFPGTHSTTSINSVTAYWIRFRYTSGSGMPAQANRRLFAVNIPYIDIQSTGLAGDVDALSRIDLVRYSNSEENKLIIGRRSYSRGANFFSHINYSDSDHNQSGISINPAYVYTTEATSPTGRAVNITTSTSFPSIGAINHIEVVINNTLASHYVGKYRAFVRVRRSAGVAGNVIGRIEVGSAQSTTRVYYPEVELNDPFGTTRETLDFGIVELPASFSKAASPYDIVIGVSFLKTVATAITVNLIDLILIPADEAIIEVNPQDADGNSYSIILDKVTSPQEPLDARFNYNGELIMKPLYGGSDGISLARERQRLWVFGYKRTLSGVSTSVYYNQSTKPFTFGVVVYRLNRYLIPRGSS